MNINSKGKRVHDNWRHNFYCWDVLSSQEGTDEQEIKNRIGQGKSAIRQFHGIIWDQGLSRSTKNRIYNTIVESI